MLRVTYHDETSELLVDGRREDYERFSNATQQAIVSGGEIMLPVESAGRTNINCLIVRSGPPPNRVGCERGRIVFSIAPGLQDQFLSFVEFPTAGNLPNSPIQYHHHFDFVGDDNYVAPDSLPVVFGLEIA